MSGGFFETAGLFPGDATIASLAGLVQTFLATLLTGVAVKILDDFLDAAPEDRAAWAFPYGAAALAVAGALAPKVATVMFLASYAVGMFGLPRQRMPSGLPAWVESCLAVGLAALLAGGRLAGAALAGMAAVQCWDDVMDWHEDGLVGQANLAARFGRVETGVAGAALAVAALLGDFSLGVAVIASAGLIWVGERIIKRWRSGSRL